MKKFVLVTVGFTQPTPDIMNSWHKWFNSIEDKIEEQVGFRNGKEVTKNRVSELAMDKDALTGYLVINAESIDEAIKIAQDCPMITSTNVYEVMKH
jgi:transcription antitermination factor NusG